MKNIKYLYGNHSDFSRDLQIQVDDYFLKNNISKTANTEMIVVSLLLLFIYTGCYFLILSNNFQLRDMFIMTILMGLTFPSIFLNIGHTASHNALFKSKKLNQFFLTFMDLIGMNSYIFNYLHNKVHHNFPGIEGSDIIVEEYSLIRLSSNQPYNKLHRYQIYYGPVIYLFFSLIAILLMDFQLFKRKRMGNTTNVLHHRKQYVKLFFFKFFYITYSLIIPLLILDIKWYLVVFGFLLMHFIAGFILTCVGVLNHQINESVFPECDEDGYIRNSKKNHEMEVTIDFAPGSKIACYLFGGFNTHVAHHLFPDICHCHYRKITRMINETAPKFGVQYKKQTFLKALRSHFAYLKRLSLPA